MTPKQATAVEPSLIKPVSTYVRRPPPLAARYMFAGFFYGFGRPLARVLESFGRLDSLFRFATRRRINGQKKANPFRNYAPTKHDVFIAKCLLIESGAVYELANRGG